MSNKAKHQHFGALIKAKVIPPGMSVTEAAKKLGVGRVALSNLLNGNAALSAEMAARLEQSFGWDRDALLRLQEEITPKPLASVAARAYVPAFALIKANQIAQWAATIDARSRLPVLLRKLIHSTGRDLKRIDFPGYHNAQRTGWDGVVDAASITPWIPLGTSGWEFGTNQDPATKAESDYTNRVASIAAADRATMTFVFVTPRNWTGKGAWATKKKATGDWQDVRAFDASDLEQWCEESIAAQIWLAPQLQIQLDGTETLERCWLRWSTGSNPPMTSESFAPSIAAHSPLFKNWLAEPSSKPLVVSADSTDEAAAFIACVFEQPEHALAKDLAAVFRTPDNVRLLAAASAPFIAIAVTDEAAQELAPIYRKQHCIIVRPRNAVGSDPDIKLDVLTPEAFDKGLAAMKIDAERRERLARQSGRSLTVLRRQLSEIDAIRNPAWAKDQGTARSLIPLVLVGTWQAKSNADCEIVSTLAGNSCEDIERMVAQLAQLEDPPVWAVGQYRGVVSKIDALFAVAKWITGKDIDNFLTLAEYVLSESDPKLALPDDQQWAAVMYGKVRNHSPAIRGAIAESLVILAVHGQQLFGQRLDIPIERRVAEVIERLLSPLTLDKLLSHDATLPRYAEAAPEVFLRLIERDLAGPEPVVYGLLRPVNAGVFGSSCLRSSLLWGLECLAWKSQYLWRVTAILAQLSRIKIDDNWMNKPIGTLGDIYRFWVPQTAASAEDRIKGLEKLAREFPDIGWRVCVDQFDPTSTSGSYSYRPIWRSDASGAGKGVSGRERHEFRRKALDLALAWPQHSADTLADLIERLQVLPPKDEKKVWDLVDHFSRVTMNESAKAELREKIRRFAFTRFGRRRELSVGGRNRAKSAYANLAPVDPATRHRWLFVKEWVEESVDEMDDDGSDYKKRHERIHEARKEAMAEIWIARGFEGVKQLLVESEAASTIGRYLASSMSDEEQGYAVLQACLVDHGNLEQKFDLCLRGFLESISGDLLGKLLVRLLAAAGTDDKLRVVKVLPFREVTWRLVDGLGEEIAVRYWMEVFPYWSRHSEEEVNEIVDRLLAVRRPRAAFNAVHFDWNRVETSRLLALLRAATTIADEPSGTYRLERYELSEAMKSLDARPGVSVEAKAQLEFGLIGALERSEYGIPNLERQIAESPALFAHAVARVFKRRDEGEDPAEWRIADDETRANSARAAHELLNHVRRIPGSSDDGKIDLPALKQWVADTRQACVQIGRADMGDHCIGQLLSKDPRQDDCVWPRREICDALQAVASGHIGRGFYIGVKNARGAVWRGSGGDQERELATKYRNWSNQLAFDYPFVSQLLEEIASSYDSEARVYDSEEAVSRRIDH